MEMLGGFVGVSVDADSGTVRPKVGWAVRQAAPLASLLLRLDDHSTRPALEARQLDRVLREKEDRHEASLDLPADVLEFYKTFDGAELFPQRGPALRIRPVAELEPVYLPAPEQRRRREMLSYREMDGVLGLFRMLCRFADLADGSGAYFNFGTKYRGKLDVVVRRAEGDEVVVAHSFEEFLERSLASSVPCHLRSGFHPLRSLGE
jgi:hypothetical protein